MTNEELDEAIARQERLKRHNEKRSKENKYKRRKGDK